LVVQNLDEDAFGLNVIILVLRALERDISRLTSGVYVNHWNAPSLLA